jgi:hypothetical protein
MKTNYMVDVAFTVEGDWENFEDIPFSELINGLQRRIDYLRKEGDKDAFGFCDSYKCEEGHKNMITENGGK